MRFLLYDLKRMFSGKALVILSLLSPIIVTLVFSAVVAPMIYTAKGLHFNLAMCDEDQSEPVHEFVNQLINSQALSDIVSVYPVTTLDNGIAMLDNGDVSVLIHIPPNIFENIRAGKAVEVSIYSTKAHALEAELISMVLDSSLSAVGKSQNLLESAKNIVVIKGVSETDSELFLENSTSFAITEYMNRREVLGEGGTLSPMGEYLPIEYYLSAIFSVFAALSILPLIHFTANDASGSILRRGLLCGQGTVRFFSVRILSGMIFILLVQLMLVPASLLLNLSGELLGGSYATNIAALIALMILSSFCYSTLAVSLGTWIPQKQSALWIGFYLVLIMSLLSGALIPFGALPKLAASIGQWLPMRSAIRALSNALFSFDREIYLQDVMKLAVFSVILLPLGYLGLRKRGRG